MHSKTAWKTWGKKKPTRTKLCYIKYGNVCDELVHTRHSEHITGGHYHYVYSTSRILGKFFDILYLSVNRTQKKETFGGLTAKNIKPILVNGKIGKLIGVLHSNLLVIIELIKFQPDHLLCVPSHGMTLFFLYARMRNIPFTLSLHSDLEVGPCWKKPFLKYVLQNSSSVICHGPFLASQARSILRSSKKIVEYNATSTDMLQFKKPSRPSTKLKHFKDNDIIFSYVGRMEAGKGAFDLYHAFKELAANGICCHLCFAGSGSVFDTISKMRLSDKLEKWVHLFGEMERKEVAELIGKSWVVITPTRKEISEGRCMTALEAISLGIPLIAPEFGAFKHIVKNNVNGLFYKPDSVSDLHDKLKTILDPDLRNRLAKGTTIKKKQADTPLSYGEAVKKCVETANRRKKAV